MRTLLGSSVNPPILRPSDRQAGVMIMAHRQRSPREEIKAIPKDVARHSMGRPHSKRIDTETIRAKVRVARVAKAAKAARARPTAGMTGLIVVHTIPITSRISGLRTSGTRTRRMVAGTRVDGIVAVARDSTATPQRRRPTTKTIVSTFTSIRRPATMINIGATASTLPPIAIGLEHSQRCTEPSSDSK